MCDMEGWIEEARNYDFYPSDSPLATSFVIEAGDGLNLMTASTAVWAATATVGVELSDEQIRKIADKVAAAIMKQRPGGL